MCAVIGIQMKQADVGLIQRIFQQSMIRGKHATGISYVVDGVLQTFKESVPSEEVLDTFDLNRVIDSDGSVSLIGHIRYSTSDLRYNQPFSNGQISIVHNGVISQEPPDKWCYKTETKNDSELILRALENDKNPLTFFRPSSMAVIELHASKMIWAYRNEARPLWKTVFNDSDVVFTSTKDIALRAGLVNPQKCEMFRQYSAQRTIMDMHRDFIEENQIKDLQR